jgi:hypothetical protein
MPIESNIHGWRIQRMLKKMSRDSEVYMYIEVSLSDKEIERYHETKGCQWQSEEDTRRFFAFGGPFSESTIHVYRS